MKTCAPYLFKRAFLVALLFSVSTAATAQFSESGSHTVRIGISPISVISVSGDPLPLILGKKMGDPVALLQDGSTFYNLTTNVANVYLQAELDLPMPEGTQLWIRGESQLGNSHGKTLLSGMGSESRIITGIERGLENGRGIVYELKIDASIVDIPFQSRIITLSLVDPDNNQRHQVVQTLSFGVYELSDADDTN